MCKKKKLKEQDRIISILKSDIEILLNGSCEERMIVKFRYEILKSIDKLAFFTSKETNCFDGLFSQIK